VCARGFGIRGSNKLLEPIIGNSYFRLMKGKKCQI